MRLLTKNEVQTAKNADKKREIDEGVKLAKKVDTLRKVSAEEETRLGKFREQSMAQLKHDGLTLQAENKELEIRNVALKAERLRLEAPIDLTMAWKEVQELKEKHESLDGHLLKREIEVTARENDLKDGFKILSEKETEITRSEEATDVNLRQSEVKREESARINNDSQVLLSTLELRAREEEESFQKRSDGLKKREELLATREKKLQEDILDITNQKRLLADRQALLARGFEELRRKTQ